METSICTSVCAERRLVGLRRLEGHLLAISIHPDGRKYLSFVALNRVFNPKLFVLVSLQLRMFFHRSWPRTQSFSSPGYTHVQIPERLVYPGSILLSGFPGFGDGRPSLSGYWCRHHLGKVQSPSIAASGLSGCYSGFHSLQGFSLPAESEKLCLIAEAFLFCSTQPVSLWRQAPLAQVNPHLDFWSDASGMGWGAHLLDTTASGLWSQAGTLFSSMQGSLLRWSTVYGTSIFW